MTVPVTALILTKNEERGIARCVEAAKVLCDQVIVVDSASTDRTVSLAIQSGAEAVPFDWNGRYPKKKQWAMDLPQIANLWVLHLDADEIVTPSLRQEITDLFHKRAPHEAAFEVPLEYRFAGKRLKYGHRVSKRSLLNRDMCKFPEVGDLAAPGITEVEGHYQPLVNGDIGNLASRLLHDDPDPISSWISRHNKYSDWEAYLRTRPAALRKTNAARSRQGKMFARVPFKPLAFFLYSYVGRLGFLDGRAGFDYAFALTWYYWLTGVKSRELTRNEESAIP